MDFNSENQRIGETVGRSLRDRRDDTVGGGLRPPRVRLGDVCRIDFGTRIRSKDSTSDAFPVYGGGGKTFGWSTYNREDQCVVSRFAMSPECVRKVVGKFFLNDSGLTVVAESSQIDQQYIDCYLLGSQTKIYALGRGCAQKNLQVDDFKNLEIPLPPLPAQREIAAELDRICAMKKNAEERVEICQQLVKSKFVEMFGEGDVNPKRFPVRQLSELITHANNGMTRRGNDSCGNIVLRIVELRDGYIDYTAPNRIVLNAKEKERYRLADGDFLFVRVNGNPSYVGRCAFFRDVGEPVFHNDHIIRVRFNADVNPVYMTTIMNGSYGKRQIKDKLKTSAGQYTINQDGIGAIRVPIPPLPLQREFAAYVAKVEKMETVAREMVTTADMLYRAKLQESFG